MEEINGKLELLRGRIPRAIFGGRLLRFHDRLARTDQQELAEYYG